MTDQLTQDQQQAVLQLEPRAKRIARRYSCDEEYASIAILELCQSIGPYVPPLDAGQQQEVLNRIRDCVRNYHQMQLWEKERSLQGGEPQDSAYTEHQHSGRSTAPPRNLTGSVNLSHLATMTTGIAANIVDSRIPENESWVARVEEVVQALPPSLRATAASHWLYNTTAEELAKDEEVSVRAIEKRLAKARQYAFLFFSGGNASEREKTWTQGRTVASLQGDQFIGHKDFDTGDGTGPFVCPLAADEPTSGIDTKPVLPRPTRGALATHGRRASEPTGGPIRASGKQLKRVRRSFTEKYDLQQRVEGEYRGTLNYRLWRWLLDSAALVRSVCGNGGVLCGLSATTL